LFSLLIFSPFFSSTGKDYHKWVNRSVVEGCKRPSNATGMARAGLEEASKLFQFVDKNGTVTSLCDAVQMGHDADDCPYWTYVVDGDHRDAFTNGIVSVDYAGKSGDPYWKYKGKEAELTGEALTKQLKKWVEYGTIEQDAADAVIRCIDQPKKYCDLKDHTFVILGATSAMGTFLLVVVLVRFLWLLGRSVDSPYFFSLLVFFISPAHIYIHKVQLTYY
jgi:hypothetical protein